MFPGAKLRVEPVSQQFGQHEIIACGACWNAGLSLPLCFFICDFAHRLTCVERIDKMEPIDPRSLAVQDKRNPIAGSQRAQQAQRAPQVHRYAAGVVADAGPHAATDAVSSQLSRRSQ